ncbi:MAG: KH domain-containing protein [Deltaproteobacteria bacterium]|nr:KH domain-containing protein [Deltaproteobacteria bacterium]
MLSSAGTEIREFVSRLVGTIVETPAGIGINIIESGNMVVVELSAAKTDIGKIIGREGRMAQSLRVLLTALATKLGKKAVLQIIEK